MQFSILTYSEQANKQTRGECGCYDNRMHGVAWAQIHALSFLTDRNVNFDGLILFF